MLSAFARRKFSQACNVMDAEPVNSVEIRAARGVLDKTGLMSWTCARGQSGAGAELERSWGGAAGEPERSQS